ncbi:hypothetical protein ACUR5C_16005 [Aliikangiella sp. IMCC44653]
MLKVIMLGSFLVFIISFIQRNDFDPNRKIDPLILQPPKQTSIELDPITASIDGAQYQVQPLYDYEIYGMLVSYRHHNSQYGLHQQWGDKLNIADLCIVWSETATNPFLNQINFWNGQFTCNVDTASDKAWKHFKMEQLSNNHIITNNAQIRDQIRDLNIGDQIRITGWLSSYQGENGNQRGTSTTRTDTGDGACETIWVNDIEVLVKYVSKAAKLMYLSALIFVVSLIYYFISPFRVSEP